MAELDDKPAPKAQDNGDNNRDGGQDRNVSSDRERDNNDRNRDQDRNTRERSDDSNRGGSDRASDSHSKFYSELSKNDWQNLGKNEFHKTGGREARMLLSLNPLGDQSDKPLGGGSTSTAVLDRGFNFDSCGKFDHFSSCGLDGSTKDPFDAGRKVNDYLDMGFNMSSLGTTASDLGLGIYTPEQISQMGFNFGTSLNSFSWDGFQGNKGWDSFAGGSGSDSKGWWKDDGVSLGTGLSYGGESILNNLDYTKSGKLDLGSSLSTSFFDKANTDLHALKKETAASSSTGWWDTVKDWGNKAYEGVSKLGNAIVNFDMDFSSCKHETLTGKHGNMEMTTDAQGNRLMGDARFNILQGPGGKNDPKEVHAATKDGRTTLDHSKDGINLATNADSPLSFEHNPATGKIEAKDKSGTTVVKFDDAGDMQRFFKSSVINVVPPGGDMEKAYQDYKTKLAEEIKNDPSKADVWKNLPVMFMDGKGETMTVQADGTRYYTHANGNTEMKLPHVDANKVSHPIEVKYTTGPDGKEHITVGEQGGKQFELNSEEAKRLMENSRLKLGPDGQLQVNDDHSGRPDRAKWNDWMRRHNGHRHVRVAPDVDVDLDSRTTTVKDKDTVAVFTPNDKGGVTDTEFKVHPDGKVDDKPSQVITTDGKGHANITQYNPATGEPLPHGSVDISAHPGEGTIEAHSDWFNLNPDGTANVKDPIDQSLLNVDEHGNILETDKDGNTILSSDGDDGVYYDGHKTYEQWLDNYTENEAEDAINAATATAAIIDGLAASIASSGNIDGAQLAALESMLAGVVGDLPNGIPLPPQVSAARSSLASARAKDGQNTDIDTRTTAAAGVKSESLIHFAREAGTSDAFKAANYALKRAGYQVKDDPQ